MSFSKNVRHCRKCIVPPIRRFHSGGSNAVEQSKIQSRTMSVMQWKLFNQLKDYVSKFTSDKSLQTVFNNEVAQLLQKIQPSVYGNDMVKRFETVSDVKQTAKDTKNESTGYSLPNVLNGLKIKIGNKEEPPKEVIAKWKTAPPTISKTCIHSRTKHVISSIITAQSDESKLRRIEDLSAHIKQYPESKNPAVKEGVVRHLLRIKEESKDANIQAAINEAFALLGYIQPLPGRGIRILSVDGGGTRGLVVLQMLKKLEELSGKKVYEMFDFICGVSTGALITYCLGLQQKEVDETIRYYKDISTQVFTQSAIWGTSNLVWSHSYYDTALWEKTLKEFLGDEVLICTARNAKCPKLAVVSAIVNQERASPYIFRNYSFPWRVQSQYLGGSDHCVWEAARASAAAPTYFEEFRLGNLLHQDGGILVNNPTAVALHEAKQLWPNSPIQCILSFGTGRIVPNHSESIPEQTSSSWKTKFMRILDSATDTEGVHTMLSDLLPPNVYYRFNPYLTEMVSMSEIDSKKMEQLERDVVMYLRRNEDKFQEASKVLCQPKTTTQKALDWVNLKREMVGFTVK